MNIGFSTGSIALGDFRKGIALLRKRNIKTIELSSLRETELPDLIAALHDLDLRDFEHVSFHAPSKLSIYSEHQLICFLNKVAEKGWLIIVHPDIISDFSLWQSLGNLLCIENMDKRKNVGRTFADLEKIFNKLPLATFCLDVAHARQVDPTMTEALLMIKKFRTKLKQLHVSDVNTQSFHEPLNLEAILAFSRIAPYIPENLPVILESPVTEDKINSEIEIASMIFDSKKLTKFFKPYKDTSIYFFNQLNELKKNKIHLGGI
ncbi:MAG: hypothetical protein ABI723_06285 [Bacteroidia bacterium]